MGTAAIAIAAVFEVVVPADRCCVIAAETPPIVTAVTDPGGFPDLDVMATIIYRLESAVPRSAEANVYSVKLAVSAYTALYANSHAPGVEIDGVILGVILGVMLGVMLGVTLTLGVGLGSGPEPKRTLRMVYRNPVPPTRLPNPGRRVVTASRNDRALRR